MCTRSASIPASNKFYVAVNGYVKGYATKKTAEGRSTLGESTIDIGRRNSGEYSGERSSGDENGSEWEHFCVFDKNECVFVKESGDSERQKSD